LFFNAQDGDGNFGAGMLENLLHHGGMVLLKESEYVCIQYLGFHRQSVLSSSRLRFSAMISFHSLTRGSSG
jgi:hypothetical protein